MSGWEQNELVQPHLKLAFLKQASKEERIIPPDGLQDTSPAGAEVGAGDGGQWPSTVTSAVDSEPPLPGLSPARSVGGLPLWMASGDVATWG